MRGSFGTLYSTRLGRCYIQQFTHSRHYLLMSPIHVLLGQSGDNLDEGVVVGWLCPNTRIKTSSKTPTWSLVLASSQAGSHVMQSGFLHVGDLVRSHVFYEVTFVIRGRISGCLPTKLFGDYNVLCSPLPKWQPTSTIHD